MTTYWAELDGKVIAEGDLPDVKAATKGAILSLLDQDPEGASQGVLMANMAFSAGTVDHALDTQGTWFTIIGVKGEPARVRITREG